MLSRMTYSVHQEQSCPELNPSKSPEGTKIGVPIVSQPPFLGRLSQGGVRSALEKEGDGGAWGGVTEESKEPEEGEGRMRADGKGG